LLGERASGDEHPRVDDAHRVEERLANEMSVEEGHDDSHPRQPEPDRHVVRAVLKQQADDIAGLEALRQRPAGITVGPLGERAVAEGCLGRDKRRRRRLAFGELLDDDRQGSARVALYRGGALERPNPGFLRVNKRYGDP
jgi:hypothetical protein